jgi:hypothetical protein
MTARIDCFGPRKYGLSWNAFWGSIPLKRSGAHHCQYFKTYIELNDQDLDLRNASWSMDLKTREIVKRVGILDILPNGVADDWPRSGRIIDHHIESPWMMVPKPTTLSGHRAWVRDELKWARLGPEQ